MRKLVLILMGLIAVSTFISAYHDTRSSTSPQGALSVGSN